MLSVCIHIKYLSEFIYMNYKMNRSINMNFERFWAIDRRKPLMF